MYRHDHTDKDHNQAANNETASVNSQSIASGKNRNTNAQDGRGVAAPTIANSSDDSTQLKAKSTVTIMGPENKLARYDIRSARDRYIPSIQSAHLHKQDQIASIPYLDRLLEVVKQHGLTFTSTSTVHGQLTLRVDGPQLDLVICTSLQGQHGSSGKCKCAQYFSPEFQMFGPSCHFCHHSLYFHRVKPELEQMIVDDTKKESDRAEYQYWFDKFIELQRMYCSATHNFSFDQNLFIEIYDQPRQALLSFIQSPNYRYVLIKYEYDGVYDEGERLFKTTYQIVSLQTMRPVETDEMLAHRWSCFQDGDQIESGFRTIVWDLNQPATLIATAVKHLEGTEGISTESYVEKIVKIECPNVD